MAAGRKPINVEILDKHKELFKTKSVSEFADKCGQQQSNMADYLNLVRDLSDTVLLKCLQHLYGKTLRINLVWRGPHSPAEVRKLHGPSDYGIYQFYGTHPVYGADTLVYIGLANENTFGERLPSHHIASIGSEWEDNTESIRIHTGRLHIIEDETPPNDADWGTLLAQVEYLLVYAHSPAWNAQYVRNPPKDRSYHNLHVLNWGQYGQLLPEVSGARCTNGAVFNRLMNEPLP